MRWLRMGWLGAGLVAIVLAGLPCAAAARLSWSSPRLVDHLAPYANPYPFFGVSCPSASLCVGVASDGRVITSRDPGATQSRWHVATVDHALTPAAFGAPASPAQLTAVTCPTARFCVAVDSVGDVLRSDDPAGGAGAWKVQRVDGAARGLSGVSCPTESFCAAVDESGHVVVTRDADARRPVWRLRSVESVRGTPSGLRSGFLAAVSCPSTRLCVAFDRDGSIVTSGDPGARVPRWDVVRLTGSGLFSPAPLLISGGGVSCPSTSLCVIASGLDVVTSTDPLGGAGAWVASTIGVVPRSLVAVDCRDASLCLAVDSLGEAYVSTQPTGGAADWTASKVDRPTSGMTGFAGASCPSRGLCVAVDLSGNVEHTTDPTGGATAWTLRNLGQGYNSISGMSCPSASLCVGYDDAGNVVASAAPAAGRTRWRVYHLDAAIASMSCVPGPFCFGLDGNGLVLTSTDPLAGAGAWSKTDVDSAAVPAALSCSGVRLCVAVDANGNAATSTDPTGGAGTWTVAQIDPTQGAECGKYYPGYDCAPGLDSVSCPTPSFCATADTDGVAISSSDPSGGGSAWDVSEVDAGADTPGYTDCASASLCLFSETYGSGLFASTDAGGANPRWVQVASGLNGLSGMSCVSLSLCVAVDNNGGVLAAAHPRRAGTRWTATNIDHGRSVTVTCARAGLCIATDAEGNALTTGNPSAGRAAWTASHIDPDPLTAGLCPSRRLCVTADGYGRITIGRPAATHTNR